MDTTTSIREALARVAQAVERRPSMARSADSPARAVWQHGLAMQLQSPLQPGLRTDMPEALGGGGGAPSPGWYFRAGTAACLASTIALHAAQRGVVLRHLEVEATSASDLRGLLGDTTVPAGPLAITLHVTLEADGATDAELRALVAHAHACAPMSGALRRPTALELVLDLPGHA